MTLNTFMIIVLAIVLVAGLVVGTYVYLRDKSLNDIRADVYQLFLEAEHTYTATGEGKQKMKWVISQARSLLPKWAQIIITDELLYKAVECWFRAVKDLLDDGKYNKSTEE